jgi:sigma-B regulation protein RsbU (phosphoserine phosphatase)
MKGAMVKRLQLILAGFFFGLLLIYVGAGDYNHLSAVSHLVDPGWVTEQRGDRFVITRVRAFASALRPGDEVVAINGQQIKGVFSIKSALEKISPGSDYTILIQRNGQLLAYKLRAEALALDWSALLRIGAVLVIPAIFLLTGFAVFLLKPYDKQALLLALMFGMFAATLSSGSYSFRTSIPVGMAVIVVVAGIISSLFWPVFLHFFLVFPDQKKNTSRILSRFPRLEFYIYIPYALILLPYAALSSFSLAGGSEQWADFQERFSTFADIVSFVSGSYIAAGLVSLLINYKQANRSSRRKMRVAVAGSFAGLLPMLLLLAVSLIIDLSKVERRLLHWLFMLVFCSLVLFPLSFAYAIVRHQVIPVRLMLRRSMRYLLVSRGFIVIEMMIIFAVLSFLLTGTRLASIDALGAHAVVVATMIVTLAATLLLKAVNRRVMPIIDRHFFREAYDAQQILSELAQAVRSMPTLEQMLEMAATKIQNALHAEIVSIFLRDDATGDYRCEVSANHTNQCNIATTNVPLVLPASASTVERLRQSPAPLVASEELERCGAALLLPIMAKDQLLGIIWLGPRLGDIPFSREDKQLLMAVAWQMAFAIENAQLVRRKIEEERLRHELEMAAEVQKRLFPQKPPRIPTLELSGICHPARWVGGDYYDFIELGDGRVGIAVADVAGKGISAALLMSTVQALLRSQAPLANGNITELVSSVNNLLCNSTGLGSYVSFFYAQYDDRSRQLAYVNAGHNPPMLVRTRDAVRLTKAARASSMSAAIRNGAVLYAPEADALQTVPVEPRSDCVRRLATGGMVIGLFDDCTYEQEAIQMMSGDVLVAYTDGVTEAPNPEGQEFSESRLRQIVIESAHLTAEELSKKIIDSVRSWCAGSPQHDDITLVVIKVK